MHREEKPKRMVMTIESTMGTDACPTGQLRVVELRPANLRESIAAWFRGLCKKPEPDRAELAGIHLPLGCPVSVGIELSPETYAKLVGGDTKVAKAIDLIRDDPVEMALVVAPESLPEPSLEEIHETVV